MVQSGDSGHANAIQQNPEQQWGEFIDKLISSIELVSSHFKYFEEYVLSHSPEWLFRKARQAQKEQWERQRQNVTGQVQAMGILLGSIFSKNQNIEEMLPPDFDAVIRGEEGKKHEEEFLVGNWWTKSGS